jgi:hypothetical protein
MRNTNKNWRPDVPDAPKPTYAELLQALREAPPWQSLGDERYRRWYVGVVMPLLERVPEPK